LKGVCRERY